MGVFVGTMIGVDVGNGVSVGAWEGVEVGDWSSHGRGAAQASAAHSMAAAASSTAFLDPSTGRLDRIGDEF